VSDIRISSLLVIPDDELAVAFARSGGPGGQNVNKVASKAELRWTPRSSRVLSTVDREWLIQRLGSRLTSEGELIVTSTKTRDQLRNREDAEAKLGEIVSAALVRPKKRRATKPSRGATERRLREKRVRAEVKKGRRGDE
jgi:ribosome-associated protein